MGKNNPIDGKLTRWIAVIAQVHLRARNHVVRVQVLVVLPVAAEAAVAVVAGAGKLTLVDGRAEQGGEGDARGGEEGGRVGVDPQRRLTLFGLDHGHVLRLRARVASEVGHLRRQHAGRVHAVRQDHVLALSPWPDRRRRERPGRRRNSLPETWPVRDYCGGCGAGRGHGE